MNTTPVEGDIFIVGVAGPSGIGKSTVAKRVASRLNVARDFDGKLLHRNEPPLRVSDQHEHILEATDEICFHRDITERQRSLDFILWQYKILCYPAMRQYVLPSKHYADLVPKSDADLPAVEKSVFEPSRTAGFPPSRSNGKRSPWFCVEPATLSEPAKQLFASERSDKRERA